MKEVVLLEPKNLGRIILDKVPGMGRGTKCKGHWGWGAGGWPLVVSVLLQSSRYLLPPPPPARRRHEYSCDRCHMAPFVLIFGREVKGLKVCGTETRSGGIFTMPSCAERLDRLSQGAPSCVQGSEMSPWGCEEACSSGEVTAFLPTLPVPRPRSGQPVRRAGGKARVARAARAGQPFSRSQSRNPLLKRKQRGGLAGVSWLVVPRSRLWRSTARPRTGWSPDSGPSCS